MSESELSQSITDAQINTAFTILTAMTRKVARGKVIAWHDYIGKNLELTDVEHAEFAADKRWEHVSSRVGSLLLGKE